MSERVLKTKIQLRYGDLDTLGHVNNAAYLTYFELGRVMFFRKHLGVFDVRDLSFVIARAELDFKKSITMEDSVILETYLESVGNTSFTFAHRLESEDGKTLFSTGKIIAVTITPDRKPTRVPDQIRQLVEERS